MIYKSFCKHAGNLFLYGYLLLENPSTSTFMVKHDSYYTRLANFRTTGQGNRCTPNHVEVGFNRRIKTSFTSAFINEWMWRRKKPGLTYRGDLFAQIELFWSHN